MSVGYDIVPDLIALARSKPTPPGATRVRRIVATLLLLEHPGDVALARALSAEVVGIDEELLLRVFRAAAPRTRLMLMAGPAMRRLRPGVFARVWSEVRRHAESDGEMAAMGSALAAYLRVRPQGARRFQRYVRSFLHSKSATLRVRGLELSGMMDTLRPEDRLAIRRSLVARNPFVRMAALFGIYTMASRRSALPSAMRMFVTSVDIREAVRVLAASERDKDVRLGARNCLASIRSLRP